MRTFTTLIELQSKNGLHVGENSYAEGNINSPKMFLKSIAEVQRIETKKNLQQTRFFSIMADGSMDLSTLEQEALYLRFVMKGVIVNKFIGLHELQSADAKLQTVFLRE